MKNEGKLGRWKTHQTYGKDTTSEIRWATKYTVIQKELNSERETV